MVDLEHDDLKKNVAVVSQNYVDNFQLGAMNWYNFWCTRQQSHLAQDDSHLAVSLTNCCRAGIFSSYS